MDAVRTESLTKTFGGLSAVDRLTLRVGAGEIFGLVGPDGAGKTTTIRLLTAILEPTAGEAWVAGYSIAHDPERIKEQIGYMSQRFGLYPDLTVMENLDFYADIYEVPRKGRSERTERLLAFSNLTPFKRRLAGNLSGGMKQKLGLACALIHTPRVLFLDEPTNGVDPVSRRDFWRILYQLLREKVTIFVSTAYLDEAERCSRLALVHEGKLLTCGTPEEVKRLMRGEILEIRARSRAALRHCSAAHWRGTGWVCSATGSTWSAWNPRRRRPRPRRSFGPEGLGRSRSAPWRLRWRTFSSPSWGSRTDERRGSPAGRRGPRTREAIRQLHGGEGHQLLGSARRDLRLPRPQRRRQVDHDPDALRNSSADVGGRKRRRIRSPHSAGVDQGPHRLHEPEVLALPGPDGRGEHRLLQRDLLYSAVRARRARNVG